MEHHSLTILFVPFTKNDQQSSDFDLLQRDGLIIQFVLLNKNY